jgi:hypothetical protein
VDTTFNVDNNNFSDNNMIEKLKDLEQEAMDNLDPETYDAIVSNVMEEYDQEIYQAGYIDGLQTAINVLAEESETMSYSIDIDDMFPDDDEEIAQEYDEITD